MRLWIVDPKIMCRQHLMAEHNECHMFLGTFKKGTRVTGFIEKNQLEAQSVGKRHDELALEMIDRGYNHQTPLDEAELIGYLIENYSSEVRM